ncbi:MAG: response regulator transcription factor [Methylotenera sp.]|nr:response regulator transcription factor [Methylotenera sp.]
MKKILLIGGFRFVRTSLRKLINTNKNLHVIEEHAGMSRTKSRKSPDIIIMDISIPSSDGIETFLDTKQAYPKTPLLIVNGSEELDYASNYLRLGCNGYISKKYGVEEIVEAIDVISNGIQYVKPENLQKKALNALSNRKIHDSLSKRELQVFFKLVNGKSILSVANDLNISTSTVSVFRSKILKKMHFKNNADLILYAKDQHCLTSLN